jgi:predicted dehydrogenase
MLRCAIIGFGGLGKMHFRNVVRMDDVQITALCDVEERAFTTKTDTNLGADSSAADVSKYRLYADYKELLAKEKLDFVIAAVPTYLHAEIAIAALEAGVHVFCEKPMARSLAEAQAMLDAAEKSKKRLMIGQCLRFWPEYVYLKEKVVSGEFGRVARADFSRLSLTPRWCWQDWYLDFEKSGGAALDLHVHDADMVNWLFGLPPAVSSAATHLVTKFDSILTKYEYSDKIVTAVGDWGMAASFGFRMGFSVRFEKAVVEMNPQGFFVHTEQETFKPELPERDAYFEDIREFAVCITENRASGTNPPEASACTLTLAFAEMESAEKGEKISV